MKGIAGFIIRQKKLIVTVFLIIAALCTFLMTKVSVNYNMADYLPEDGQSTGALLLLKQEFPQDLPNARVMLTDVTLMEVLKYKESIAAVQGVTYVLWLDDVISLKEPIEMADPDTVGEYYKDHNALLSIAIAEGKELTVTDSIRELIGDRNALAGDAVNIATTQKLSVSETINATLILIPLIIIILLLSTSSWIEPLLFLGAIGISVLLNMGSNLLLGEVSFMTQAISPILQMAVSLDYAIFLLHSFEDCRRETEDIKEAMHLAIKRSSSSIMASAATTMFGFLALMFMEFRIGADLGLNLLKGIIFSYISVMVFLPALTLSCYKLMDKTRHKKILPEFKDISKYVRKLRLPCLILVAVILVPSFLAQKNSSFIYGAGSISLTSRGGMDEVEISTKFGQSTPIVILVPRGYPSRELLLSEELRELDHVQQVISYATMVGPEVPADFLREEITEQFYSANYSRMIVYTDTAEEGDTAFSVVEQVQGMARNYYGDAARTCGQSVTLYDMKNVVTEDTRKVNFIAVVAIALVLLFIFRSVSIPLLLLLTIETAIWVNLAIPYFQGNSLCYIGYLVINTVQLGATVDYAILLTDNYRRNRMNRNKREAIQYSLKESFTSILVSAVILSSAGFCIGLISTNPIVSELGMLLGRGTVLSMAMVILFLPQLLVMTDPIIEKTTLRANFYKEAKNI